MPALLYAAGPRSTEPAPAAHGDRDIGLAELIVPKGEPIRVDYLRHECRMPHVYSEEGSICQGQCFLNS